MDDGKCEIIVMGLMNKKGDWDKEGHLIPKPEDECEPGVCSFYFKAEKIKDHGPGKDPVKATLILDDCEDCNKIEICYEGGAITRKIKINAPEWDEPDEDIWDGEGEEEEDEEDDGWKKRKRKKRKKRRKKHPKHQDWEEDENDDDDDEEEDEDKYDPWDKPKREKRKSPCACGNTCKNGVVECILGAHVVDGCLIIRVNSNGNTTKKDFKWCVFKGCTGKGPFMIEFCRCRPDHGDEVVPNGVKLEYPLADLCLDECESFTIRNPICCTTEEDDESW